MTTTDHIASCAAAFLCKRLGRKPESPETYDERFARLTADPHRYNTVAFIEWEFDAGTAADPGKLLDAVRPKHGDGMPSPRSTVKVQMSMEAALTRLMPNIPAEFSYKVPPRNSHANECEVLRIAAVATGPIKNTSISVAGVAELIATERLAVVGGDARILAALADLYAGFELNRLDRVAAASTELDKAARYEPGTHIDACNYARNEPDAGNPAKYGIETMRHSDAVIAAALKLRPDLAKFKPKFSVDGATGRPEILFYDTGCVVATIGPDAVEGMIAVAASDNGAP